MTIEKKRDYLTQFAGKWGLTFSETDEIGFGRKCVGFLKNNHFLEYNLYDDDTYEPIDGFYSAKLHEITPEDAYHKHSCVAVLGGGEDAIRQLYDWVLELEKLNIEIVDVEVSKSELGALFGNKFKPAIKIQN